MRKEAFDDDASIDFSVEELVALVGVLDLGPIPGLGEEPLGGLDESQREIVVASAIRSLVARRAVAVDEDRVEVAEPVADLVRVLAAPGLLGRVQPGSSKVHTGWHVRCDC